MARVRLAIADDHPIVLASLRELVVDCAEIDVVGTACDGDKAVSLARQEKPDVFLIDIVMPKLDGLQAISRIHDVSPSTNVLLISMHDEPEYLQEALARGAIGLVSKAASPGELIDAIKNAARGETMDASAVLTDRQREVLLLIGAGKTKQEIALLLSISEKTVDNYQQQLMEKLDIHTKIGLVAHARQLQLADN